MLKGRIYFPNGDVYQGNFTDLPMEAQGFNVGKYTAKDSKFVYEGKFKDNKFEAASNENATLLWKSDKGDIPCSYKGGFVAHKFQDAGKLEIGEKPDTVVDGYWHEGDYEGTEKLPETESPSKIMEEIKEADVKAEDRR